ncbi:MAG: hypothetical protein PHD61_05615 [Bacteroidales bacterium]|nr:hypothetical protein [Lentimicrobiaceae bacterium]MDD5694764.1 hypothetical protein [Bacteroidales bacterium]
MEGIFVPISVFGMILGIVYLVIRKRERLALIEKGVDASIFMTKKQTNATLKWGLFFIGLGIGLLVAEILVKTTTMSDEAAYFSMIFLFGGVALLVSYFLDRRKEK